MGVSSTLRQKWNEAGENVPVIHILPRGYTCPNASPFPLKLETYLRMKDIKYEVDTEHPMGPKSKVPWMTLNGKDIADSQMALEALMKARNEEIDGHLTPQEKAIARAFLVLNEDHLYWVMASDRFQPENMKFMSTFSPPMPGVPGFLQGAMTKFIQRGIKKQTYNHGIGRHSWEEMKQLGLDDLQALSDQLGNKPFFMGMEPSLLDASIFGMLCQILYCTKEDNFMRMKIKEELVNLEGLVERIKEKYWSDWDETLGTVEKVKASEPEKESKSKQKESAPKEEAEEVSATNEK
ncbi:failed axon connections-like [Tigriopus californicus]|uniref:failed axon connections-like n=1 Tax=Tigriopus californicus TaxID=6832 RepID=UPI0027DA26CD|nr:failed axon connections-like [Tigriopus californicus]